MVTPRSKSRRTNDVNWSIEYMLLTILRLYTVLCSFSLFCSAKDSIEEKNLIAADGGKTLVSGGGHFELGFFTPSGAPHKKRYLGIWYSTSKPQTVVWVANRDNPLSAVDGVFAISDGNLKILDANGKPYWSTDLEPSSSTTLVARLEDSGNLVLRDNHSQETRWQSFENATDTFLPGMYMSKSTQLTSWKDHYDPGTGNFTFRPDQGREGQYVIYKNDVNRYWVSGDVFLSSGTPGFDAIAFMLSNFSWRPKSSKTDGPTIDFGNTTQSDQNFSNTRLVINYTGELLRLSRDGKEWSPLWREPRNKCSVFNPCGNFGICNIDNRDICKCLPGFEPSSLDDWSSGSFSKGCTRNSSSSCKNDGFLNLTMMKVGIPDLSLQMNKEEDCRTECLTSCENCQAYSFQPGSRKTRTSSTCYIWSENLKNLQGYVDDGQTISVRVAVSHLDIGQPKQLPTGRNASRYLIIVALSLGCVIILSSTATVYVWRRKTAIRGGVYRGSTIEGPFLQLRNIESQVKDITCSTEFEDEDKNGIDVPFFTLDSILSATDNFSEGNKLGKGGYGPVYRGEFAGGQEMAVKRLLSVSGQGFQEFKNEVVLIAKLQHRNLVRLLGYCIDGGEKILLYEYMPNKSLDSFLFDQKLSMILDWGIRYNIILGIARGLLYLHQDSRLRIIHRDLKTSNILLDRDMNPKISDFGLARIVAGNQTEANTIRVVGTYGYMSPEYALDGIFSVKSDVFSFGVVLLEIISGRKNTGFYQSEKALSLLGYAWKLWTEDNIFDLMDPTLKASCGRCEFLKCMNVGLLCVQEDPQDRPSMANVVTMLSGDFTNFPNPRQPAFVLRRGQSNTTSSSSKPESVNVLTTTLQGR